MHDLPPLDERPQPAPATLGDILYTHATAPVPEQAWVSLVQAAAAGNQDALHALYQKSHRLVFTLILRMTTNREIAEELTLNVFLDVWRRAPRFDRANGSVLAWIMKLASAHALDRLHAAAKKRGTTEAVPDPRDVLDLRQQEDAMRGALAGLTPDERHAIETTFFAGLNHVDAAARLDQPPGAIKLQIRSGLHKLRRTLLFDAGRAAQLNPDTSANRCERVDQASAYVLQALPPNELAAIQSHIVLCPDCQFELASLRQVVNRFVAWPTDVLRPPTSLQARLALRLAEETRTQAVPPPPPRRASEPDWEDVAPGIECKLLATDLGEQRVSMLVRLAPGATYPAHTHAGLEELHLLDGELWIDERKLRPGDYNVAAAGTGDDRVWSETGCTCVLITSTQDILR